MSSPIVRNSTVRSHYESVERVIVAMRSQIDQPFSLGSMARIALASRYHFNRTFREVTGVPPSQFLYALRLEKAKRLLLQTQRKVIDICYDVGYNSVGTFTRRFTDLLGVSPTTFRDLARTPSNRVSPDVNSARSNKEKPGCGWRVSGYVKVPPRFRGLVFVGLFETPIPQGKPLACAAPSADGSYCIEDAPEGEFYLFALGLKHPINAPGCFDYESALRGGGHALRISRDSVEGSTYVRLRPPSPFDPPILLLLPVLMEKFFSGELPVAEKTVPGGPIPLEAQPLTHTTHQTIS
ncbi:MAG TPA: AraC family transcriptional regulator [Candidatus Angelobacter sp.]|nr:AraC family transcriptional regulator [Candidatus Angelobacter sp.]